MKRWAVYARYSSDRQNPKSCDDQIRECEARIAQQGGFVVKRYADEGVSGAHESQRPQYQAMVAAMRSGVFDAVISEDLDRFNRNLEASARLYSLAVRDRVEMWTLADGRVSQMHVGLRGLMGEMFLQQLADKTRRGNLAVAHDGRIPGGNCYGYAVAPGDKRGRRVIVEAEAAVIRRIFSDYAAGVSPVAICAALNADGIAPPRGREWRVSALVGNVKRLNGLLVNPIYVGRPVFNRQRFAKDPETGKRFARPNPPEAWIHQDVPELRIVAEDVWQAVQDRRVGAARQRAPHELRRARTLLSGLVRCEECGSAMVVCNGYFRCTSHDAAGTCGNNRGVRVTKLEGWVVEALRTAMDDEEVVAEYVRHLRATVDALLAERARAAEAVARRRAELTKKVQNLMAVIEDGTGSASVVTRIRSLEAEIAALDAPVAPRNVVTVVPDAPARFRAQMAEIEKLLNGEGTESVRARELVRSMISRIGARRDGEKIALEVDASLGALLAVAKGAEAWSRVGCGSPQHALSHDFAFPVLRMVA